MNQTALISLVIFGIVLFRVGSRAWQAYTGGFKTWPIIALLGAIYLILLIVRLILHIHSPIFFVISLVVYYLSYFLYRAGVKANS